MTLALRPELQQFVDEQVTSGRFGSATEVMEAALARMMIDKSDEDEPTAEEVAIVDQAIRECDAGLAVDISEVRAHFERKYLSKSVR